MKNEIFIGRKSSRMPEFHVVYGVVGLKTHAKTSLVVRQEQEGLRSYAHIGTGNYNVTTSRFYTDLGLLTAREEITGDVIEFFHFLTGRSLKNNYTHLLIAPVNMLIRFKALIEREAAHAKAGKPGQIIAKFNNFEENDIAIALYDASQKGVEIDMMVRGFCCLRPGVPGMSERLRVTSLIGRFLEHSRIFLFPQWGCRSFGRGFLHRLGRLDVSQFARSRGSCGADLGKSFEGKMLGDFADVLERATSILADEFRWQLCAKKIK